MRVGESLMIRRKNKERIKDWQIPSQRASKVQILSMLWFHHIVISHRGLFNSLRPSDAIWQHRSGSTLAISYEIPQPPFTKISLKITYLKLNLNFPGANELTFTVCYSWTNAWVCQLFHCVFKKFMYSSTNTVMNEKWYFCKYKLVDDPLRLFGLEMMLNFCRQVSIYLNDMKTSTSYPALII